MCLPLIVVAATVAYGAYSATNAYQQGVAEKKYYDLQADQSRAEGEAIAKAGQSQSERIQDTAKEQGKKFAGEATAFASTQRATMAAMGLSGSTAENIVSSTFGKQELDKNLIRYNADVKSWETLTEAGYKNWTSNALADQYNMAGKMAKKKGTAEMTKAILSTVVSVASLGVGGAAMAGTGGGGLVGSLGSGSGMSASNIGASQFSLGSGVGAGFSDIRLKENIILIGKTPNGFNIYKWDWKDFAKDIVGNSPNLGLMAQEVQGAYPEAVSADEHGYLRIDYNLIKV